MAGYSNTPLLKKLGIGDASRVRLVHPPTGMPEELARYASSRLPSSGPKDKLDIVILFADSLASYKGEFARWMYAIKPDGAIWIGWPKKASGMCTDMTDTVVRDHALQTGFVDVKVCAIDERWSGLKLVVRKELRADFAAVAERARVGKL